MLYVARKESEQAQAHFVDRLSRIAATIRDLLVNNGLVRSLAYRPTSYWPSLKGNSYAFIDGGVANIELPSAAPIGIRVGSYVVRPGDETEARERFNIELALVDDLFSDDGILFDDDFQDIAKLRDAARMTSETAAALRLARQTGADRPDAIVMHGPLINPVAPYGLEGFPPFGLAACRKFLGDDAWEGDDTARNFVSVYLDLLKALRETGTPVVGAVERSIGRDPVVLRRLLDKLQRDGVLKKDEAKKVEDEVITYGLNDATLLDVVLAEGEYVTPIPVMRQGPESKWPEEWKRWIREYPDALTTYLKPSALVMPFRVEAFDNLSDFDAVLDLILHTSRLLPSYGFPVGLDIVDKFAKVPAWMTRGIKGQHQVVLLKKALESGDPATIAFAKRVLAAKGRDWLFRPTA
ncbi:MAG: DNA double-strand break repair nuclease NurA [Acetobacteraceae bacterium]|nr:DNA double-strand break repair nuclease NurA [Acetobacteraceae bacterium]